MSVQLEAIETQVYNSVIPQGLGNRYIVWRHGESEANVAGIIVSDPEIGVKSFGLTAAGRVQVRTEVLRTAILGLVDNHILLYCSPFLRCAETADEIAYCLGIREITTSDELRERNFGELEGKSKQHYRTIYDLDRTHPNHGRFGVESVGQVLSRTTRLIWALEQEHHSRRIILVTHADVGEILQTAFLGLPPQTHRELPKLRHSEPRELRFAY